MTTQESPSEYLRIKFWQQQQ